MTNDKIQQYILAAGKDSAIQDVGLYEHPQQVYMLGASVAVALVMADWIKDARIANLQSAPADLAHNAEFDRIQTAAKRYETLRRLNARQFADLYAKNIETGVAFDELVDQIIKEGN